MADQTERLGLPLAPEDCTVSAHDRQAAGHT
jgi:hypothetical protein